MGHDAGTPIALTAPLTESIDHAGARAHLLRRHRDDDRLRPALCVLSAGPEPTDLRPESTHHGGRARQCRGWQPSDLAKRYAAARGASVSRLVERYLDLLSKPPSFE
jgi:hypothetical protein